MAKQISSYKNLNWEWSEERKSFLIDYRPIGGTRSKAYRTKTEMWEHAQALFERWRDGVPVVEEEAWTLERVFEKYKAVIKMRMEDPNERFGPKSYSTQCQHLDKLMAMKINGLRLGKMKVKSLSIDFMIDPFWPHLRDNGSSQITSLNYYTTLKQLLGFCVTRKQIPSNVAKDATDKSLTPRVNLPSRKKAWRERLQESVLRIDPPTIRAILDAVEPEHKNKVKFATRVGLRAGEQCALKVIDTKAAYYKGSEGGIDFDNNCVIVRIAKKRGAKDSEDFIGECKSEQGWREIPISQKFSSELKAEWDALPAKRKVEGWLFPTTHGTMGNPNNWRERILYEACDAIGLTKAQRPRWHDLRHSYATQPFSTSGVPTTRRLWSFWVMPI